MFRIGLSILSTHEKQLLAVTEAVDLFHEVAKLGRDLLDAENLLKTSFAFQMKRQTVVDLREVHRLEVEAEVQTRNAEREQREKERAKAKETS
eukprot:CAMPEP_0184291598 /NCGR_PEP_ID=MMETSP1049-20130417/3570_1 /TAXON_ID=77928 /ORGANISM="Proteomonas sulcata, Strain CCMP704" /LENGTH=92 /DNA_ID=CAMNT_0026599087 /DNA_START=268 /DNA_END=546 /DNA_ORIENTATION=+